MPQYDRSSWTVETLADFLDERQAHNAALISARYEADQSALRAQIDANDKRLEGMNAFRAAMSEQAARAISREEHDARLEALREKMDSEFAPLQKAMAEHGKPNWMLLIGLLSVTVSVLAGCWLLIGLQINVANTPQSLAVEGLKASFASEQQAMAAMDLRVRALDAAGSIGASSDSESRVDRTRLNARVASLEDRYSIGNAERKAAEARFTAALVEIETQFCAADSIRNLTHAADMRFLSLIWSATRPGEHLPTDNAFYPVVCNRAAAGRDTR